MFKIIHGTCDSGLEYGLLTVSTGSGSTQSHAYLVIDNVKETVQIRVDKQDLIDVLEKLKQEQEK